MNNEGKFQKIKSNKKNIEERDSLTNVHTNTHTQKEVDRKTHTHTKNEKIFGKYKTERMANERIFKDKNTDKKITEISGK